MLTKPDLKLVAPAPLPYDEAKGIRRVKTLRDQLFAAALRYIQDGSSGTMQDRLRQASDLAGIPRNILEIAVKEKKP